MADMPWPGAVAVSGGGDSLALMHLLAHWARGQDAPPPLVLCVDHGLRPESGKDARAVARWAKAAGLKSRILTVTGKKPKSDIEAWARTARYSLMGRALARHGLKTLYLAHHQDDQAETFLIRLARGSGLDGLSAMKRLSPFPVSGTEDLVLARPLLAMPRAALRDFLKARGQAWLEDPMNGEARFVRSRISRALLPGAGGRPGLSVGRFGSAAAHLARAPVRRSIWPPAAVLARVCAQAAGQAARSIRLRWQRRRARSGLRAPGGAAEDGCRAHLPAQIRVAGASVRRSEFRPAGRGRHPAWLPHRTRPGPPPPLRS